MADNFKFFQGQPYSLAGAGAIIGDTTITLKSMTDIDGGALSMATTFGSIGYMTLEPGNGELEEQISFTGLTNNSNSTVTLTGVKNVLFAYPYTETSGLFKTHAGSTTAVISNTSGFYNKLTSKSDDETITGLWDFPSGANNPTIGDVTYVAPTGDTQIATKKYVDDTSTSGAPNANTTTKGIVQLPTQAQVDARTATGSTGASLTPTPANLRTVKMHDSATSAGGTDTYAITLTPTVTAYADGDIFFFKADVANTGACTLNVNTVGAIALKVYGADPRNNYITAGSTVECRYNSTGPVMNIISVSNQSQVSQDGLEIYATDSVGTDAYAITLVPAIATYSIGLTVRFKAGTANTGAATLAVNGLVAKAIVKNFNQALVTGDIVAGQMVEVIYDSVGDNFQMLSPSQSTTYTNGVATYDISTADGTQALAHGLGKIPKKIRLTIFIPIPGGGFGSNQNSYLSYNGTTVSEIHRSLNNATDFSGNGTTIVLYSPGVNGALTTGTVTFDVTNINIAWVKTNSPTGIAQILWETEG